MQPHTLPRHWGWSRKAAAHSSSCLATKPGTKDTQVRLDLSQELREALLVHAVCRVRLGPELLGVAIVELDLLLVGDLDHTDRCDCGARLVGVLRPLVSLVHELIQASHCQLHFLQLGRFPRELSATLTSSTSIFRTQTEKSVGWYHRSATMKRWLMACFSWAKWSGPMSLSQVAESVHTPRPPHREQKRDGNLTWTPAYSPTHLSIPRAPSHCRTCSEIDVSATGFAVCVQHTSHVTFSRTCMHSFLMSHRL